MAVSATRLTHAPDCRYLVWWWEEGEVDRRLTVLPTGILDAGFSFPCSFFFSPSRRFFSWARFAGLMCFLLPLFFLFLFLFLFSGGAAGRFGSGCGSV